MRTTSSLFALVLLACTSSPPAPLDAAITPRDATMPDAVRPNDATAVDGSTIDGSTADAATAIDAGPTSIADVIDRATFTTMFLHQGDPACSAAIYDYDALVAAAARFPAFLADGTIDDRRREAAAFFANVSHETTGGWPTAPDGPYAWGLCFREELGCSTGTCTGYCDPTSDPCASGQTYQGRGPLQLSWNYNYAQCGTALGQDLSNDPGLVTRDGTVGWETALWFWMTPQSPKPSCHDAITGRWTPSASDLAAGRRPGFGVTIDVINGGLECHMPGDARVADRVGFYTRYTTLLGVSAGSDVDCASMSPF